MHLAMAPEDLTFQGLTTLLPQFPGFPLVITRLSGCSDQEMSFFLQQCAVYYSMSSFPFYVTSQLVKVSGCLKALPYYYTGGTTIKNHQSYQQGCRGNRVCHHNVCRLVTRFGLKTLVQAHLDRFHGATILLHIVPALLQSKAESVHVYCKHLDCSLSAQSLAIIFTFLQLPVRLVYWSTYWAQEVPTVPFRESLLSSQLIQQTG